MKMNSLVVLVFCFFATVNCQWVVHNHTVINTTVIQNPGYGPVYHPQPPPPPPQYGFRTNVTRYDPYGGYVNQSGVGRRNGNDLIVGTPGPSDVILFKQWFTKAGRWLQTREKIIPYPPNPWANRYQYTITAVGCFDIAKGPGGHASILSGGPGHKNVTIRLFSDRGEGFNFKCVIHGR